MFILTLKFNHSTLVLVLVGVVSNLINFNLDLVASAKKVELYNGLFLCYCTDVRVINLMFLSPTVAYGRLGTLFN